MIETIRISAIAALDRKRGIGKDNRMPWKRIQEDMAWFVSHTKPHPLIYGRNTSVMGILLDRPNIIMSRDEHFSAPGAHIAHSLADALYLAESIERERIRLYGEEDPAEIFIAGGGQIYTAALEAGVVDRLYLTQIDEVFGCEVFFPEYVGFREVVASRKSSNDFYTYTFQILDRE